MLDNCSQGSFIKDEIIEDLGIPCSKLKQSLKTLTGEKSEDTESVDGLIISAVDCKKGRRNEWLELPKAYSKNCLPVERDEIRTPDKIKRGEYLKVISKSDEQYWRWDAYWCKLYQSIGTNGDKI